MSQSINEAIMHVLGEALEVEDSDTLVPVVDVLLDALTPFLASPEQAQKIARLEAEIKRLKTAKPAQAAAAAAPKVTKKAKTSSGKERKANAYSLFVKATKVLKANVRAENADICGIEVTVNPAYKDPTKPCAAKFQEYKDQILHNGDSVEGQTLTVGELFDAIVAVPELSNGMTRAGMLWGLIGEEAKTKMSEYGAAME